MQKKNIQENKEEIRTKKGGKSRACNQSSMIKIERSKLSPKGKSKENSIAKSKINEETRNGTNLETKEASRKSGSAGIEAAQKNAE